MRAINVLPRILTLLAAAIIAGGAMPARAAEVPGSVTVTRTNWVPRYITNVIEVQMPRNYFVEEYRTNYISHWRTNAFNVYQTNRMIRTITNSLVVPVVETNYVSRYLTNWSSVTHTNWETVTVPRTNWVTNVVTRFRTNNVNTYETNWTTRTLTNLLSVLLTNTNLVTRYQTNVTDVTFTNWEPVLLFRTNHVTALSTNFVDINLPAEAVPAQPVAETEPAMTDTAGALPPPVLTDRLAIEAGPTGGASARQLEVLIRLKAVSGVLPAFVSQEWRVEHADSSIIAGGRGAEFKRELPFGAYNVEVIGRLEDGRGLRVRGAIEITRDGVRQQR